MSKKTRAPRNPQTIPELLAAIGAKNENLRRIRKENGELVAAFRRNANERKAEINAREEMVAVLNEMKAEAKEAKVAKREEIRAAAAKKKPIKKAKKAPEKKETKKTIKTKIAKKAPTKKIEIVPENLPLPLLEIDPLIPASPTEMEIF